MPCDYRRYHPDWKSIVRQIKDQADNRCEFCGVENGQLGYRENGIFVPVDGFTIMMCEEERCIRIVLTVAHLDHDIDNNDPANLRALCQQCHLRWDAELHQRKAAETRRRKKIAFGQMEMVA